MPAMKSRLVIATYKKQRGICPYCRGPVDETNATWEHIVPRAWGGPEAGENVALACQPCNSLKSSVESLVSSLTQDHPDLSSRAALFILRCAKSFVTQGGNGKKFTLPKRMRYFWMAHEMLRMSEYLLKNQHEALPYLTKKDFKSFI